jgi:hypothetical protein
MLKKVCIDVNRLPSYADYYAVSVPFRIEFSKLAYIMIDSEHAAFVCGGNPVDD